MSGPSHRDSGVIALKGWLGLGLLKGDSNVQPGLRTTDLGVEEGCYGHFHFMKSDLAEISRVTSEAVFAVLYEYIIYIYTHAYIHIHFSLEVFFIIIIHPCLVP